MKNKDEPTQTTVPAPWVDPTDNVRDLVESSDTRNNDLRKVERKLFKSEIKRIEEQVTNLKQTLATDEKHGSELRTAESGRIDSIRQVDVSAVKTEADRALLAIQALASTTATNADNLRNALTVTAATIAKSTADTVGEITTRLAALEKAQYESRGKEAVADPVMADFMVEMRGVAKRTAEEATKAKVLDPQLTEFMIDMRQMQKSKADQDARTSVTDPVLTAFIAETRAFQAKQIASEQESAGKTKGISAIKAAAIAAVGVAASLMWIASLAVNVYLVLRH
jgi:hypothetical protein